MFYGIFPLAFYAAVLVPEVESIPTEIIAMAMRYLGGESLLNAYKVSRKWKNIILGDPVLRQILKLYVEKLRRQRLELLMNPQSGVRVERQEASENKIFTRNMNGNKRVIIDRPVNIFERRISVPEIVQKQRQGKRKKSELPSKNCKKLRM